MEINHLVHNLKHGYQYSHTDEAGETHNVLVPPNKYMIKAAAAIEALHNNLQQTIEINSNLTRQLETHIKELIDAKARIQHLERKPADGDTSADFQRGTDKG